MGDSRILYTIILKDSHRLTEDNIRKSICFSADSTLSEVISHISSAIDDSAISGAHKYEYTFDTKNKHGSDESNGTSNERISLNAYDCTTYPPKDITSTVNQYTNNVGPKSITLQRLGWFPSGKLYICQSDDKQTKSSILNSNIHSLDDFEYNNPNLAGGNGGCERGCDKAPQVLLKGDLSTKAAVAVAANETAGPAPKPLPSDLFKAVQSRFDDDANESSNNNNNNDQKKKRRTEAERRALLDRRLEQLDQKGNKSKSKKNKKVSDQVKKMLIKSRAVGNKKILQCDKFYLDVVLWDDTAGSNSSDKNDFDDTLEDENKDVAQFMSSSYMFFSRVATVGRIISCAVGSKADSRDKGAELLVLTSSSSEDGNSMVYRRLPPTLPLHEAESKGLFCNFGRVVVRIFQAKEGLPVSSCYTQSIDS